MSDDSIRRQRPRRGAGDIAHSTAKAGLSQIPFAGGAAAELFALVIAPPLEKRRDEWMASIADELQSLEEKVEGFKLEDLSENDVFITTVLHASQIALRNHQQEKLEALRNAVLNSAMPNPPDEDLQLIWLNYIDDMTTWHLRILSFFEGPERWGDEHGVEYPKWPMGSPAQVLEHTFPDLNGQREFYDQVIRDLHSRGLFSLDNVHGTMSDQGMFASRTSGAGNKFIAFITVPRGEPR